MTSFRLIRVLTSACVAAMLLASVCTVALAQPPVREQGSVAPLATPDEPFPSIPYDAFDNEHLEVIDGDFSYAAFPEERAPLICEILEAGPTILTWPDKPMAEVFARLIHGEHDEPRTDLEEFAIGLQAIPERPPLVIEWNERFLGPGFLSQGLVTPTGAVWRPSLWVFGQHRSAYQYADLNRANDPVSEVAHRLDLFGQVNLSGTERILVGFRPLDEEQGVRRNFTGYDFRDGDETDGWNAHFQTLFFEGDFGEVFPFLDPYDSLWLDYGFSVGRMPLIAQQGLLINEDMIDAATITRNTVYGLGNLNLRATAVYAWYRINRNSPTVAGNVYDPTSKMVALLTESDYKVATINVDAVYAYGSELTTGDVFAFGVSAIQRHHLYHNTYNTSVHLLSSYPVNGRTPFADQGELLFAQTSWTPHHTEDLIYLNGFWAIDQFTSPARGPLVGGPLGQTGILFAAPALGRVGAPIGVQTDNRAGGSLGYQIFFDHTRRQIILEVGGHKETKGPSSGALGLALRYQQAIGQHLIFILDSFVAKREHMNTIPGARAEILVKF